jgi:branched-chain amino acid transport system ATP-binding protein
VSAAPLLQVEGLGKNFGGLAAVAELSFDVAEGEIFAIIGPNGAGKTTTLNLLSGLLAPSAGTVRLTGRAIQHLPSFVRTHLGLGRAFQVVQPFPEMTVRENVLVGALFGTPGLGRVEGERRADAALERTGLSRWADHSAEDLTLMQEKRLEIARALATAPRVLMLDEVMAGLRPAEAREAVRLVREVRDAGVTVVFIEHVMPVVRDLADRVLVMDHGRFLAEGTYAEVTAEPQVIEAYLGREEGADDADGPARAPNGEETP